ncbi:MAG: hypothetical protein WBA07_13210, partial [Rivularia sp. (in: cyanobacteria)]
FSIFLVLVGIPNRAENATTSPFRRTIMSLRNDRQISRHPKTNFEGQLVCPCRLVPPSPRSPHAPPLVSPLGRGKPYSRHDSLE